MLPWQKIWLILILIFFILHSIRDILQLFKIRVFLATFLTKKDVSKVPRWYWKIFNEFLIEVSIIFFSIHALSTGRFGSSGYLASILALFFEFIWLIYYFLL